MIIHPPEVTQGNGEIKISARVEMSNAIPHFPDRLWFSFPESYQPDLTPRSEAFLLPLLVPAMYYNEEIEVRGRISPRLAANLREFAYIYHRAFDLPLTGFTASGFEAFQPATKPEAVMLSFSGGVDSMYSLYMNLPENQPIPQARVTHGLLIQGFNDFDIALKDTAYFERVHAKYQKLFDGLGLTLLTGKTNAYDFCKFRVDWDIGHTPTMVAFGYLFSNLVRDFMRASSGGYIEKKIFDPWLLSNHLLSSETIHVVSHTTTVNRVEKMEALSHWPTAHDHLRVCLAWDKTGVDLNCSKCYKCLDTMILFYILGVYDKFTAFEQPYNPLNLLKFFFQPFLGPVYAAHFVRYAKKYKRYGIIFWCYVFFLPNKVREWSLAQFNRLISDETRYKIRERFFGKREFDSP
jgi:hypothetical protein